MAEVWFMYDYPERRTSGGPQYELTLDECIEKLNLSQSDYIRSLKESTPKYKQKNRFGTIKGPISVEIRIDENEAEGTVWRSGFYDSLSSGEVITKLGEPKNLFSPGELPGLQGT